jgi:hypothetical protein
MGDFRHTRISGACPPFPSRSDPLAAPAVRRRRLLAVLAYRDLLLFEPRRAIPDPVERMLFEPADTTPALIIVLALWLLWRRRARWRALPAGTGSLGLALPLLAGAAILVWARLRKPTICWRFLLASGLGLACSEGRGGAASGPAAGPSCCSRCRCRRRSPTG